jgi:hypothetical protein
MREGSLERFAPLAGIVFLALIVLAVIVGGGETPDANDTVRTIKSFYADNDDKVMLGDAIGAIAGLFLVWFAASLRRAIYRVEGGDGRLATLTLVGGAAAAMGAWVVFGVDFAVADASDDVGGVVLQSLNALNNGFFLPLAAGWALFMLASGFAIVRTGVLPRAFGWIALLLGVTGVTPIGFFSLLIAVIWVAVVSVMLYLREGRPVAGAPAPAATAPTAY